MPNSNTKCVHAGIAKLEAEGMSSPIFTSTAYKVELEEKTKIPYPRYHNTPNIENTAAKIASLENAEHAFITSSGMAAITSSIMALVEAGDHILVQKEVYGGTYNFIEREISKYGIAVTWFKSSEAGKLESLVKENTKIIYVETPSNPLLSVVDLQEIADFAKKHKLVSIIDNTFATPILQRPLEIGIDISVHSGTKYFGGHSDLICGAIAINSDSLGRRILEYIKNHGATLDAKACYILERSLKTLGIRVERQSSNAQKLAEYLEAHKQVTKVNYPGLKSFAGHETAAKQMSAFGGMLSFELDADLEASKKFIMSLELIGSALSLGGVESTICMPRITSHAKMTTAEREEAGISDSLIRLSVGIEDIDDLIGDFNQAFAKLKSA